MYTSPPWVCFTALTNVNYEHSKPAHDISMNHIIKPVSRELQNCKSILSKTWYEVRNGVKVCCE